MSRIARGVLVTALSVAAVGTWLASRPARAQAQSRTAVDHAPRYQVNVVATGNQPGWLVLDTQTGAMELWQRDADAYEVTRYQFGGTTGAARQVPDPAPRR